MSRVSEFEELPEAMVLYLAARLTKVSKHAGGRQGQKCRAKARRRGTWGKAVRRRQRAAHRLAVDRCVAHVAVTRRGLGMTTVTYDEAGRRILWQEPGSLS